MKRFALILTLVGLAFSIFGCKPVKEGPFTFTNKTTQPVAVIITQDKTVEKTLQPSGTNGDSYTGEDYYTPKITLVKGLDEENKKIIDNTVIATTTNGFDYTFVDATAAKVTFGLTVSESFIPAGDYANWYVKEVHGKLGDTSEQNKVTFQQIVTSPTQPYNLYTNTPEFRIYRERTVDVVEDLTEHFSIYIGKENVMSSTNSTSTTQWNVQINYPKVKYVVEKD